jgi:hypothetical protein
MILFQALSSPIMSFPTTAASAGSSRSFKGQIRWFLFSVVAVSAHKSGDSMRVSFNSTASSRLRIAD